jgi:uncharacterized protein YneF (UPF0154 family)
MKTIDIMICVFIVVVAVGSIIGYFIATDGLSREDEEAP